MILKFILGTSAHKYKKYINVIVVEIQVLKQHTETNHKGLKKYKCDTCEKYFTALGSLKNHTIKIQVSAPPVVNS